MKTSLRLITPLILLASLLQSLHGQDLKPTHATLSAFTSSPHPGIVYTIDRISTYGACVTVEYIRSTIPGFHAQVVTDYEEHISIPVIDDSFEYIDAVDQFGNAVPAVFLWQGQSFESTPCPIVYVTMPPSFVLYEAPGAQPLVNTSNRSIVIDEHPAIAGFVLNQSTWVIIRGIGSSMDVGSGYITDPVITLHADQYLLDDLNDDLENSITNDNWRDTLRVETLLYWEMAPAEENESALVTYLHPGAYTVHLRSNDEPGTGLVEVYIAPYALPEE